MFEDEKREIAKAAAALLSIVGKFNITISDQAKEVAIGAARAIKAESDTHLSVSEAACLMLARSSSSWRSGDAMIRHALSILILTTTSAEREEK